MVHKMISKAKRNFVLSRHDRAISHMANATGYKRDKWKTYIYENGKRKEVLKNTEEELFDWLYKYYEALDNRPKTLQEVFDRYMEYKQDCLGRSKQTIYEDRRHFKLLGEVLLTTPVTDITDENLKKWFVLTFMPTLPTETSLRKQIQIMTQTFDYGIRQKVCFDNPMKYISAHDYLHGCNLKRKLNEEKEFSLEELEHIRTESMRDMSSPRTLMRLLSMETGARAGELPVIHKTDIEDGFIHIHRQQRKDWNKDGHEYFMEVPYTKDERMHPHDGRYVPVTELAQQIIDAAKELPGDSPYLFHDNGAMISKDSYVQNLRRFCHKIGLSTTHNHAFRMAFNSRMVELGFSASDRALILGHEVQTNETHYSLTDKRRLNSIRERLK